MQRAFSLIELLIAMALGMIIIYTAVAGFRLASSSISVANRLSVENRIIRAGIADARDKVDFWTDVDAPAGDAADSAWNGQALRVWTDNHPLGRIGGKNDLGPYGWGENWWQYSFHATSNSNNEYEPSRTKGAPFAAFSASTGASALWPRVSSPSPELQRGWSATYAWPAHDSRTWWYGDYGSVEWEIWRHTSGNPAAINAPPGQNYNWHEMGRYGLFANRKAQPTLGHDMNTFYGTGDSGPFGRVDASHSWRDNQMWSLRYSVGPYGMYDYMPANAISSMYGAFNFTSPNTITEVDERTVVQIASYSSDHFPSMAKTQNGVAIALYPYSPYSFVDWGDGVGALWTDYNNSADTKNRIIGQQFAVTSDGPGNSFLIYRLSSLSKPIIPLKPDTWPNCDVRIFRRLKTGHYINSCEITWTSPLTGEKDSISFMGFGSSLRGARQQRALTPKAGSGGWAAWYKLGHPSNDLTLDDYKP